MLRSSDILNHNYKDSSGSPVKSRAPFFNPLIQPKLTINQPNDMYEQQADAMAAAVMRMPDQNNVQPFFHSANLSGTTPKKCAHCENEDKLQMKGENGATGGMTAPSIVHDVIHSGGQPLDAGTRDFMESRFSYDFGNVQIHNDSLAHQSSAEINALAYTHGNHVVFGSGQYWPTNGSGSRLLVHELAHVVQQDHQPGNIQRMKIGSSPVPSNDTVIDGVHKPGWSTNGISVVPDTERKRVTEAINMIKNIIDHPETYARCFEIFMMNIPGNSPAAFKEVFDRAIIWKVNIGDPGLTLEGDDTNIGYSGGAYEKGGRFLAQTLLHEMGHLAGISNGENHFNADVIANYCIGPLTRISLLSDTHADFVMSYKRFFDLAFAGKLQLTAGAEFNLASLYYLPGLNRPTQIANGTVGFQARSNLFGGGADFGGLTFGAEAGLSFDKFQIKRVTGPDEFEYGPGVIVKAYLGAEFYIPTASGVIDTLSVEAGPRYIIPLNSDAEKITEYSMGVSYAF